MYQGQPQSFDFSYRDPWEVMVGLATDASLAPHSIWHSAQKTLCRGGFMAEELERLFDEPYTGDEWWETDSALPSAEQDSYAHCYMPVHIWLDKGNVTTKVKKHLMLLRAAWLPSKIRNASGNGGGVLLVYMPIVTDPGAPGERSEQEKYDFQQFKKEIYQAVLEVIFKSLRSHSRNGYAFKFGDGKVRVGHPGIEIESMDGEEIAHWTGVHAATAQHPCPKCVVDKSELHSLSLQSTTQTTSLMRDALDDAQAAPTKTEKGKILQQFGMHDINHFLWNFKNSDPYSAASYDVLHFDDLGKWGKHLWPLLLRILKELKGMANFPQWPKLKHFSAVTNIEYSDKQAFFNILKCCLPCLVDVLPKNEPMLFCIRAYQKYRMMIGLSCHSSSRLDLLEHKLIPDYERRCKDVSLRYDKNFDFFKQHWTSHIVEDIRRKGSTVNTTTRPGEGFQQEAAQAYKQTNGSLNIFHCLTPSQMSRIDEKQEAIASICMNIDYCNEAHKRELERDLEWQMQGETDEEVEEQTGTDNSWTLKAPQRVTDSNLLETTHKTDPAYKDFDLRLRGFVAQNFPHLYLLRCNTNWNKKGPRADSVLIHAEGEGLSPARLVKVFRCKFAGSGRTLDLALVRMFTLERKWKPRTVWDGCQVFTEDKQSTFVSMEYIIRGALLAPTKKAGTYTLVDCADYDMFLRANKYE
ncbi:hypothetical protein C8J56DRAFT_1003241 [Mycena floridula]|nr:hypothetical protein C8J56DRAFT_1003241 [Mycena floridula]